MHLTDAVVCRQVQFCATMCVVVEINVCEVQTVDWQNPSMDVPKPSQLGPFLYSLRNCHSIEHRCRFKTDLDIWEIFGLLPIHGGAL